ncbi:MAG: hypothetical protein ACHQ2E_08430 [Gemmatimonadales bacterium]
MVLILLAACGGPPRGAAAPSGPAPVTVTSVLPLDRLYVLEMSGAPPADTVVAFANGTSRTVIVRHAPPDNNVFLVITLPAGSFTADSTLDSIRIRIRPQPGRYGVAIDCNAAIGLGATITFKYPVHFLAPRDALQRYGTVLAYERALAVARQRPDGQYDLLASTRPATDNLAAPLGGAGVYLAAAPR